MSSTNENINDKKEPEGIGIVTDEISVAVPVLTVHLIAVDFINPVKPLFGGFHHDSGVAGGSTEHDELAVGSSLRDQRLPEHIAHSRSGFQMALRYIGMAFLAE